MTNLSACHYTERSRRGDSAIRREELAGSGSSGLAHVHGVRRRHSVRSISRLIMHDDHTNVQIDTASAFTTGTVTSGFAHIRGCCVPPKNIFWRYTTPPSHIHFHRAYTKAVVYRQKESLFLAVYNIPLADLQRLHHIFSGLSTAAVCKRLCPSLDL